MIKYGLIALITLLLPFTASAQVPKNNLNLEFFGTAIIAAFHYERVFKTYENHHFAGSIGLGASIAGEPPTIPLTFSYNRGHEKHFLELGLGYTAILDSDFQDHFLHGTIGYKRIVEKGFAFKIRLTPIYFINEETRENLFILSWAGIGFGYSF